MKDLQHIKTIAEQMFSLSAELLRLVDLDEVERARLIEDVKKMPPVRFCTFPA